VHVCKLETLREAYRQAKQNDSAPGVDGVTFEAVEAEGLDAWLQQLTVELIEHSYRATRLRRVEIPKRGGKGIRVLSIPTIRDRVAQGALKLVLEPIFEADFQSGSYGYRPKQSAHQAVERVAQAIVQHKTRVLNYDLRSFFDNVRHHILFEKVARRVDDPQVMHLLRLLVKATGKKGLSQAGVLSPLLSNLYLNEVDRMLERAQEVTCRRAYTYLEYARFADDLVILVNADTGPRWMPQAVNRRLRMEFGQTPSRC
jgi:RNA-directed DNA polymerase